MFYLDGNESPETCGIHAKNKHKSLQFLPLIEPKEGLDLTFQGIVYSSCVMVDKPRFQGLSSYLSRGREEEKPWERA